MFEVHDGVLGMQNNNSQIPWSDEKSHFYWPVQFQVVKLCKVITAKIHKVMKNPISIDQCNFN